MTAPPLTSVNGSPRHRAVIARKPKVAAAATNEMLESALSHAAQGMYVFPVHGIIEGEGGVLRCTCGLPHDDDRDAGKHPVLPNSFKGATIDAKKIKGWWGSEEGRNWNIGVRTGEISGLTVLDVDIADGKQGAETMTALNREKGDPDTFTVITGSGGVHYWFLHNAALTTSSNTLGPGVDCRNDGGYVVAPPSRHRSGNRYTVDNDRPPASVPKHLLPQSQPRDTDPIAHKKSRYSIEQVVEMLGFIPADDRDLWRNVGIILGREFDRSAEAWNAYLEWSNKHKGKKGRNHDAIMREAFYELSMGAPVGAALSMGTIVAEAKKGGWRTPSHDQTTSVTLVNGNQITPLPIDWLWKYWLALGKLQIIGGAPGQGKTTAAIAMAATVTSGGRWPDGSRCEPANVLMWSGEDDPADTLLPRLIAAGGDRSRIFFVGDSVIGGKSEPFDPARDLVALTAAAERIGNVRLVIVDPIVAAVAGDSHKNAEVRRGLQPLVNLASHLGAAVLGISHFSKGTNGRDPIDRLIGSVAFGALPRVVMFAALVRGEEGNPPRRVFIRAKSNIGPDGDGFEYVLEQLEALPGIEASRVLWGKFIEGEARELLAEPEQGQTDEARDERQSEIDFLQTLFADGPVPAKTFEAEAKAAGFSERSMKTLAKKRGYRTAKETTVNGVWIWSPPSLSAPSRQKTADGSALF